MRAKNLRLFIIIKVNGVQQPTMLEIKPRWWIGKDSLGIVYDVTHRYNLEKKYLPQY